MIGAPPNLPAPAEPSLHETVPFPSGGEDEAGAGFTIAQVWSMVRARMWLSVGIFALLVAVAFVVIKSLPKNYSATAALMVNSDNLDPLAGRNTTSGQQYGFFPTQRELIYNSVILQPVIEHLKLQSDKRFTGGLVGDPQVVNEVVENNLRQSLDVKAGVNGSQMLYISATSRDPGQAAEIANAVADEYLSQVETRTNAPAIEGAARHQEQTAELEKNRDIAHDNTAKFRQQHPDVDLGETNDLALANAEKENLEASNALRRLEGQEGDAALVQADQEVTALQNRRDTLKGELAQAQGTFGPNHPTIRKLKAEIDSVDGELQSGAAARLKRAQVQARRNESVVGEERRRQLERRNLQDQYQKLVLDERIADEKYAEAMRSRDQVQFRAQGNYQDVTLVSKAYPPTNPSASKKLKLFAAALFVSFILALGGPFAYELLFDRRIRCRDDLERGLRIMMLARFGPMTLTRGS